MAKNLDSSGLMRRESKEKLVGMLEYVKEITGRNNG